MDMLSIDNIARFLRENPAAKEQIPYTTHSAFSDAKRFLKVKETSEKNLKIADIVDLNIREIENQMGVQSGSAGYGSCMRCGRTLTNPTSVARGIGPECIKHDLRTGGGGSGTPTKLSSPISNENNVMCKSGCGTLVTHVLEYEGLPCNLYHCSCCPVKNESPCPKEKKFGGVLENLAKAQNH
jgi:hypothetical protein